jgi:hypothetical protein
MDKYLTKCRKFDKHLCKDLGIQFYYLGNSLEYPKAFLRLFQPFDLIFSLQWINAKGHFGANCEGRGSCRAAGGVARLSSQHDPLLCQHCGQARGTYLNSSTHA